MECNSNTSGVKAMYFVNASDMKFGDDGTVRMKRKYGKFKRPVTKVELKDGN